MEADQSHELTNTVILRVLNPAPAGGSDPVVEAAAGAQLLEDDRAAFEWEGFHDDPYLVGARDL